MTFNYRCCLQFNALYMYGHDYNLLPVDANGEPDSFAKPEYRRARWVSFTAASHIQRRFRGRRMAGLSLDDT